MWLRQSIHPGGLNMAYKYNAADWACYNKPSWLFSRESVYIEVRNEIIMKHLE